VSRKRFHTRNKTVSKPDCGHSGDSSAKNSSRNSKRHEAVRIVTFETSFQRTLQVIEHQSQRLGQISFFLPSRRSSRRRFTFRRKPRREHRLPVPCSNRRPGKHNRENTHSIEIATAGHPDASQPVFECWCRNHSRENIREWEAARSGCH